jgi:type IV secretion system protein VirB1
MEMMGCQGLAVPAIVMRHVVHVESGANPYAIGVVGARLLRQPKNLDEAVATARMLEARGYNFSLGIAQVNRSNLGRYGLDSHDKAFDACANLSAGAHILANCYASAGRDWGKAFSCYYSGNFVKGFEDGYVQKVYDSISRDHTVADNGNAAIPLTPQSPRTTARAPGEQDRIAMRSLPLGTVASPPPPPAAPSSPMPGGQPAITPEVFVPQVRGPGDSVAAPPAAVDRTDLRQGGKDSAFVF